MKRTLITPEINSFPKEFHPLLRNSNIYDSSCSPEARVYFIDAGGGYFLKRSPLGSLRKEALMTEYFHTLALSCEVVDYFSEECDWLLTRRIPGEDLTHYTDREIWLCDRLAEMLRELHERDFAAAPIKNRTEDYLNTARRNYKAGIFDTGLFEDRIIFEDPDEAMRYIEGECGALKSDTLLHGDYCLPNIIMNGDSFSGFIDLGGGGVGDRHIDIFWGAWTLNFNLKTDRYRERFYDAYGRDKLDEELIKLVSVIETFG